MLWQGLRPALAGIVLGVAIALAAGRALAGLLYEVPARDPVTLTAGVALVLAIVLMACALPAWRATGVPASVALREP